jgi:membrane protein YqaA with SNARE-associated domain
MFKGIYQKTLKLAGHKSSKFYLALISFAESSFFPIPPDIMIVPMVIAKKNNYLKIFFIATLFSAFGGLFGYFIGSLFTEKAILLIELYGYEEQVLELKNQLSSKGNVHAAWLGTLFLAGFTPLPFKLFTITSGIINFDLFVFFFICLLARGLRFFIVAFLSAKFGKAFGPFIEKKGAKWFSIIGVALVVVAIIIYSILN